MKGNRAMIRVRDPVGLAESRGSAQVLTDSSIGASPVFGTGIIAGMPDCPKACISSILHPASCILHLFLN
jgi:hypothetical protein